MDATGKTVARIEEQPTGEDGRREDETVLIHFTDGTALKIEGGSYEAVSQSVDLLDRAEVNEWQRRAMGRRETERLERLQRQEWLSISCEERGERKRAREAKMSPIARVMRDEWGGAMVDMMLAQSRLLYGVDEKQQIVKACENCGERECPNATVEYIEARPPRNGAFKPDFRQFEIKIEPGTLS